MYRGHLHLASLCTHDHCGHALQPQPSVRHGHGLMPSQVRPDALSGAAGVRALVKATTVVASMSHSLAQNSSSPSRTQHLADTRRAMGYR